MVLIGVSSLLHTFGSICLSPATVLWLYLSHKHPHLPKQTVIEGSLIFGRLHFRICHKCLHFQCEFISKILISRCLLKEHASCTRQGSWTLRDYWESCFYKTLELLNTEKCSLKIQRNSLSASHPGLSAPGHSRPLHQGCPLLSFLVSV